MSRPPVDFLVWVAIVTVVAVEMMLAPGLWLQLPDGDAASTTTLSAPDSLRTPSGLALKR